MDDRINQVLKNQVALAKKLDALDAKLDLFLAAGSQQVSAGTVSAGTGGTVSAGTVAQVRDTGVELPEDWPYPKLTAEICTAIINSTGIAAAAEKLDMERADLDNIVRCLPHLYGERWSVALKRALANEPIVDPFTYPPTLTKFTPKRVRELIKKDGATAFAKSRGLNLKVVKRYSEKSAKWWDANCPSLEEGIK